jgi:hypothetical protein
MDECVPYAYQINFVKMFHTIDSVLDQCVSEMY